MLLSLSKPWQVGNRRMSLKWFRRLTVFTAFCVWSLIVLGGMVRVTGSGTGCGESWPLCQGGVLPGLDYHELVEWNHRLFATLVGLLMAVTVGSTLLWYRKPRRLAVLAILAAATYLGQAILGGITVLLHLDQTWVAAHMGNSMLLLASVTLLALFARLPMESSADSRNRQDAKSSRVRQDFNGFEPQRHKGHKGSNVLNHEDHEDHEDHEGYYEFESQSAQSAQRPQRFVGFHVSHFIFSQSAIRLLAGATLVATFIAMLTGSAVVGAGADLACPSWPQCSAANLLPTTYDAWINFGHRMAVGMSDVLMLLLTLAVWRFYRGQKRLRVTAHLLALLYFSQVFLGAFTIWLGAPEALRGAHLALAAATWSALVVLATLIWVDSERMRKGQRTKDEGRTTKDDELIRNPQYGRSSLGRSQLPRTKDEGTASSRPRGHPAHANRKTTSVSAIRNSRAGLYFSLIKPRVIPLLLVPTVASMLMAAVPPGGDPVYPPDRSLLALILLTMLGGTLATAGAHSINQYLDRDIDAKMRRTKRRPVVTHQIPPRNALIFGIALTVAAFLQLWLTVNLAASLLALGGNLFYVFVYTLWLKRTSVQNIVIGGAAGAVPPLVGWAAVTGGVGIPALLFFAIIFFWTPAHFWALALVRQEDYRSANVPMLPVVRGESYTRASILRYSVLLLIVSLLPIVTHSLSWLYLAAALGLGILFVARAVQLAKGPSTAHAWGLFKYSNIYLALLYLAMVLDRTIMKF